MALCQVRPTTRAQSSTAIPAPSPHGMQSDPYGKAKLSSINTHKVAVFFHSEKVALTSIMASNVSIYQLTGLKLEKKMFHMVSL